ncbi:MAG: alpha/beta fold hydrolase [Actinomycetota bacterium]
MLRKLLNEAASGIEYVSLLRARPELAELGPGDGHPVIVAPGLLGTDRSTWLLRRFLAERGYHPTGWGLGRNLGSIGQFDALRDRTTALADDARTPVSIIGWSLGGVAARYAAAAHPGAVRQVITLGSPIRVDPRERAVFPAYARLSGVTREDFTADRLAAFMDTPAVPTTSIASRDDAIVPLADAWQPSGPRAETVEVGGSHVGLARNPEVFRVIADRLAQPLGAWQPYGSQSAR